MIKIDSEIEKSLRKAQRKAKKEEQLKHLKEQQEKELKEFNDTKYMRFLNSVCLLSYLQAEKILTFFVSNFFDVNSNGQTYVIANIKLSTDFLDNPFTKNLDEYDVETFHLRTDSDIQEFSRREHHIYQTCEWYKDWKKEQERLENVKINALSKLNDEEKKLLGLK